MIGIDRPTNLYDNKTRDIFEFKYDALMRLNCFLIPAI